MKQQDFINIFIEELEIENSVIGETKLSDIAEMDSVGRMLLIGLADEHFGKKLLGEQIDSFSTMFDLMNFLGAEK